MSNIDVNDIRRKLTDEHYLKSLVTKIHDSNSNYGYPSEWSSLMQDIATIYNEALRNGTEMALTYGDFFLFLDGTIASWFKENVSKTVNNTNGKVYECDKLTNLACLPLEISTQLFAQDGMIDALEGTFDTATHGVCLNGGIPLSVVIASKFSGRIARVEVELSEAKHELSRLDLDLSNLQSSYANRQMEKETFYPKYDEVYNKYKSKYQTVLALEGRREKCHKMKTFALGYALEGVNSLYSGVKMEDKLGQKR